MKTAGNLTFPIPFLHFRRLKINVVSLFPRVLSSFLNVVFSNLSREFRDVRGFKAEKQEKILIVESSLSSLLQTTVAPPA